MNNRRCTQKYYFSVEGETENWYLKHLQRLINNSEHSKHSVDFNVKIKKDPREMVKSLTAANKVVVNHLCDIESKQDEHIANFHTTLDHLKTACKMSPKVAVYKLGYSNFTFDLWIALHKIECSASLVDREKYLDYLNSGFGENFISMKDYKKKDNFKRCLGKISLDDVLTAVKRADKIMEENRLNGNKQLEYKKYTYYADNPSLSVHEIISSILKECGLTINSPNK